MLEQVQSNLNDTKKMMNQAIDHYIFELGKIRAGKANAGMLTGLKVEYFGSFTNIVDVANIKASDARTIFITPFDRKLLDEISKSILHSNLGLNPQNNGESIILNIPILTEERRKELVKSVKVEVEHVKISIRNARKNGIDAIKKLKENGLSEDNAKTAEEEIDKIVKQFNVKIDNLFETKEKDIMTL